MPAVAKRKRPADQGDDAPKKPTRQGVPLTVWLPDSLRKRLDDYIDGQRIPPALTNVVRLAIAEFLDREDAAKNEET